MWSRVIDLLRDDFRCIASDMRLRGSSEDDGLPFTYWEAARDALAILDWTQLSRAHPCRQRQVGGRTITDRRSTSEHIADLRVR
jgi:3-oxoadipate enol-lactonase